MVLIRQLTQTCSHRVFMYIIQLLLKYFFRSQFNTQRIPFPKLVAPVFGIYFKVLQHLRMILLQVCFNFLARVFLEITLYISRFNTCLHLPNQVQVIVHNYKCIQHDTFLIY